MHITEENNAQKISMIVLAGGLSSRMGQDKATLRYHGRSFLAVQIEKGHQLGIADILVSGYKGQDAGVPVIPDRYPRRGPLSGLEACLRRAACDWCLVLSIDVPLVPTEVLHELVQTALHSDAKAVILHGGGREQPLIAMYRRELADEAEAVLLEGRGSVFAMLQRTDWAVYESFAPAQCFVNINDPDSYGRYCL